MRAPTKANREHKDVEDKTMYPDPETMAALGAMRREEIRQEVLGARLARQAWRERAAPGGRWGLVLRLRGVVARLSVPRPLRQPTI
jgi:hypothetical protein